MLQETEMSVEAMVRRRRRVLLGLVLSWGLWQATRIVGDFTDGGRHFGPLFEGSYLLVEFLTWVAWTVQLVCFLQFGKKLRAHPALTSAMWDELYEQTRLKAALAAFVCTVGCQGALIIASLAWRLTAVEGANITILVAVCSFLGALLWMERE